jgi:hypothetical protein
VSERPIQHGTCYAYEERGCRCGLCRTNHNERVARNRADRLARGDLNHGARSAYDAGCRCEPCRIARSQAYADLDENGRRKARDLVRLQAGAR